MTNQEELNTKIELIKNRIKSQAIDPELKQSIYNLLDTLAEEGKKVYVTKVFECEEYLTITDNQLRVYIRNYGSDGTLQQKGSYIITSKELPSYVEQHKDAIDNEIGATLRR